MTTESENDDQCPSETIRVVIQQPSLAKYRVPVFRELAAREGIEFDLLYGDLDGIPNVDAQGFRSELVPLGQHRFLGTELLWHTAQGRAVSKRNADVAVLVWNARYLSLIPTLLKAKLTGVKTILWGHGYSKAESTPRRLIRQSIAKLSDALLFYNQPAADQYLAEGFSENRVYVACNSLDQAPVQAARQHWLDRPDELEAFKHENELNEGPTVLYVSRFETGNRVDLLIEAAAKLRNKHPHLNVILIGKENDEQLRLKALAEELGVTQNVRFLGAIYEEEQLAAWFLSADVFCYPANIGLSLLHAFGYGLPVVTGSHIASHNPEIAALRDGKNGALFPHGDSDALASTLERFLSDSEYRNKLGSNAWQTATEEFTLGNMIDGFEAAIRYCYSKNR
ncbi:MAG: glycosyltransferase family 4 protein [Lacipirellulaceae bacterium]